MPLPELDYNRAESTRADQDQFARMRFESHKQGPEQLSIRYNIFSRLLFIQKQVAAQAGGYCCACQMNHLN